MEKRIIDFQITTEIIRKMLQGLKYSFITSTEKEMIEVVLHPPHEGIFFTKDEINRIERMIVNTATAHTWQNLLREKWGN